MSFEMRILGWESEGLKCPNVNLNFGEKNKVEFIQMQNGTGKTFMLTMLKAALTGESDFSKFDNELDENDKVGNILQLLYEEKTTGRFCVRTKINNEGFDFSFEIDGKKNNLDAIHFFTRSSRSHGIDDGWHPPVGAEKFLNSNFIDVYLFDAEKTDILFKKGKDVARKAIDTVCQIDVLTRCNTKIKKFVEDDLDKIGSKGTKAQDTKLKNKLENAKKYLKEIEIERKSEFDQLNEKNKRVEDLKEFIKRNNEDSEAFKTKNNALIKDKRKNDDNIKECINKWHKLLLNPANFSSTTKKYLNSFANTLDKASLPANVASGFFKDISEQNICICGNEIGEKEKNYILENRDQYLDSKISNNLGSIINFIKDNEDNEEEKESAESLVGKLLEFDRKDREIEIELEENENKYGAQDKNADANQELGKLEKEIDGHIKNIKNYDQGIEEEDLENGRRDIETILSIKTVKYIIKEYENIRFSHKSAQELKNIQNIIEQTLKKTATIAKKKIIDTLIERLQKSSNDILSEAAIQPKIVSIDNNIVTSPSKINKGAQKVINYVFFDEALKFSNLNLPFIVDSPVGAMDDVNRRNWAETLPHITEQFITFITPTDRDAFFEHLVKEAGEKNCSYHTIFAKTPKVKLWLEKQEFDSNEIHETERSGSVKGITHMRNFNLSEDEYYEN